MTYCDDHVCETCPAAMPGGPCWRPEEDDHDLSIRNEAEAERHAVPRDCN